MAWEAELVLCRSKLRIAGCAVAVAVALSCRVCHARPAWYTSPPITTALLPTVPTQPIADACRPEPVVLAYLFGSHARGTADAESDIDIAVLADPHLPAEARAELRLHLMQTFAEALHVPVERLDVVVLQDAPLLLRYNVVRGGRPLFTRDAAARRAFERSVERSYDDQRLSLAQEADRTLDRLLSPAA